MLTSAPKSIRENIARATGYLRRDEVERALVTMSEAVRQHLPGTHILFTSGYAEGVLTHEGRLDPGVNLLQKPYTPDVLSNRIRHLLRRRKPAA